MPGGRQAKDAGGRPFEAGSAFRRPGRPTDAMGACQLRTGGCDGYPEAITVASSAAVLGDAGRRVDAGLDLEVVPLAVSAISMT